jgi:predicted small lipoprotein YifL
MGMAMNRLIGLLHGLAFAAALASALALAGCGRKGPLELPPTSNLAPDQPQRSSLGDGTEGIGPLLGTPTNPQRPAAAAPAAATPAASSNSAAGPNSATNSTAGPNQANATPPKTFFLDFLIGK